MTAQQLKNSILQMAVQGKLVPQDPNDEPASVLLERIRAEKEKLIKEKKIKKEKNPSVIFRGADNTPYEKIGDEVRSLADEVPFDIPDSWEWVRLGNIGDWGAGATPSRTHPEYYGGNIPWLKTGDLTDSYIDAIPETITELALEKTSVRLNPAGSVLIAMYGATIGKLGILSIAATTNQACCACFPLGGLDNKYLFYFLMAQKPLFIKQGEGGAQPNISKEKIVSTLMPVPPLEEQRRIVVMLGRIFPIIDAYSKCKTELDLYNTTFPERLKKSILQEAVKGKLVPQDPSDEPAEALLERIRAEKQRLIKEGKIKKDKHESVIFRRDNSHYEKRGSEDVCIDEEVPFEIPENWAWARLSSFGVFSSGKTPSMSNPQFWNGNVPWVTSKDMKRPVITDSEMHISELAASTMQLYPTGTLLLVARSGILKRILPLCKLGIDSTINQDIKAFSLYDIELSEWLFYGIKAFEPYILKELVKSVTTVESLKFDEFATMLIPVPPLSEQRRIIAAIKAAMNLLAPLSSNPLFSL